MIDKLPYDIQNFIASKLDARDFTNLQIALCKRFDDCNFTPINIQEDLFGIPKKLNKRLDINFKLYQNELKLFKDVHSIDSLDYMVKHVNMLGNVYNLNLSETV